MWKRLICSSNNNPRPFPTTRFSVLAKERRFEELADLLYTMSRGSSKAFKPQFDVPLPLHCLLQYQPPLCLVNMVLKYTKAEYTDAQGRNALHVACCYNCNVAILARLINYEKCNLNRPDILQRRYPLHFLCDDYDKSLATSALFIRDVYPPATLHKDIHGMTPADILQQQQQQQSRSHHLHQPGAVLPGTRPNGAAPGSFTWQQLNAIPFDEAADAASTTTTETATRMLHIPIEMKETISDLTNATAFLLNSINTATTGPTTNASFHSKSTCSTTNMVSEDAMMNNDDDDDDDEEQQIIVQAVRKQLTKQQPSPAIPTTSRPKATMKLRNNKNRFNTKTTPIQMKKPSTRQAPVFQLPPHPNVASNNTDWDSVRC